MDIKISSFGPLDTVSFSNLKDLVFIYGQNNIGKSYAISLLYLIIKNYAIESTSIHSPGFIFEDSKINQIRTQIKRDEQRLNNPNGDINFSNEAATALSNIIESILIDKLENSFSNSYSSISSLQNRYSDKPFSIDLNFKEFSFSIKLSNDHLTIYGLEFKCNIVLRKIAANRQPRMNVKNNVLIIYYQNVDDLTQKIFNFSLHKYMESVLEVLKEYRGVYYLPSSRSGLYRAMTSFSAILAELAKMRSFFGKKISFPNISEQDLDYFTRLMEINNKKISERFSGAIKLLEANLLKGEVLFDSGEKKILYKPASTDLTMEITSTSSMVGEVSPIVLYLKYIVGNEPSSVRLRRLGLKSMPLIFIEEPEAHLHPEAQLELVTGLVLLVKAGCKLIITSHSNYIFNTLNNILISDKEIRDRTDCFIFTKKEHGCIAENMGITEFGVEDKNFLHITDKIFKDRVSAIEKLNGDFE